MDEGLGADLTADLRLLDVRHGHRLLDIGCGPGRHLVSARGLGAYAVGVDASAQDWSRDAGSPAFLIADAARLPFPDAVFDRVVCTEVLEHVDDPVACVGEMARVMAPGALAAVSVPTSFTEDVLWRFPGYAPTPGGHVRIFRTGELARLLTRHGFSLYAMRYRHFIASVYWLLRCLRGVRKPGGVLPGALSPGRGRRLPIGTSRFVGRLERLGDLFWPKSLVLYARRVR